MLESLPAAAQHRRKPHPTMVTATAETGSRPDLDHAPNNKKNSSLPRNNYRSFTPTQNLQESSASRLRAFAMLSLLADSPSPIKPSLDLGSPKNT
ncbi:hypothetical protein HFV02_00495 [Acidithiobacillus caldus]|nr:hypothetical protein [Acidithiobacillus caldus]